MEVVSQHLVVGADGPAVLAFTSVLLVDHINEVDHPLAEVNMLVRTTRLMVGTKMTGGRGVEGVDDGVPRTLVVLVLG